MQRKYEGESRERAGKGDRAKTVDDSLLSAISIYENFHDSRKYKPASIKSSTSGEILSYLSRSRSHEELRTYSEL